MRRAQRALQNGQWHEALAVVRALQGGAASAGAQKRVRTLEAECHRAGLKAALAGKDFESALEHALKAAALTGQAEAEARVGILEAMLAEVRRLFATPGIDTAAIHQLIGRILMVQNPCLEAYFWKGLCHLREGHVEKAMSALQTARTGEGTLSLTDDAPAAPSAAARATIIDPPLYLGALYLRQGQAKEALRYLTEANRLDGNCPIVTCQLATAMIAAGGDTQLAIRALQRGLRGLGQWRDNPHAAWREALPEQRSYVRKLADKHAFTCPLWGGDLRQVARQGETALGQALYRLGQFKESADIFGKLMQDAAPTLPVLRGYGLALARIGNYDEAFKHLRAAHELDEKDRLAAGYLALCGAKGKPAQEVDEPRNVLWAIRLVSEFTAPGEAEWANLVSAIFAEARALNLPLERDDQLYLCEHLLSVRGTDPQAADSYHHLQATHPQVVTREYAWLYCRAAQQHNIGGPHALELFARTFADPAAAPEFYEAQGWSFDDVEIAYLERAAVLQPGAFPAALGQGYARRGEELLMARSLRQADAGQLDAARTSAHTLLKLSPHNAAAHDRLAML